MTRHMITVDGNEAVASVAHRTNEVIGACQSFCVNGDGNGSCIGRAIPFCWSLALPCTADLPTMLAIRRKLGKVLPGKTGSACVRKGPGSATSSN
jgi:hypothetical protein